MQGNTYFENNNCLLHEEVLRYILRKITNLVLKHSEHKRSSFYLPFLVRPYRKYLHKQFQLAKNLSSRAPLL